MTTLLTILITLVSVLLIAVVLIQNPKGGGLSSTFGGGTQLLGGVKKTTDLLDRATWVLAIGLVVLVLVFNMVGTPVAEDPSLQDTELAPELETSAPVVPAPAALPNLGEAPQGDAPAETPEEEGQQP
jgi:preprotein translocase subunit SecG